MSVIKDIKQLENEVKDKPRICPKCKSPYWDKVKTKFNKDEKK